MGDVEVSIPGGRDRWPPGDRPLVLLKALPDHGRRLQENDYVNYTSSQSDILEFVRKTGEVKFNDDIKKKNGKYIPNLKLTFIIHFSQ